MRGPVYRLLDANANRAREALRVLEDYARFILNDQPASAALKELRHELASALAPFLDNAILHRDTPNDVGTANSTAAEQHRTDLAHIVIAAGKRLGEALRSIEEYLKTADGNAAVMVEALRYRFYDVEQTLARTLRPANRFANVRLYVLITEAFCRQPWLEAAEQALCGGADCLQLREKSLDPGQLLARARQLVAICRTHGALCIINDRPDIAILADADGVHVGQEDLPVIEARKIVGSEKIVGLSTHNIEQARQAVRDGADYIGVGPVFPSGTKPREILPGPAYAAEVAREIRIPAIAIAGITPENVDDVLKTGLRAVAVTSAVTGAENVRHAAFALKAALRGGEEHAPAASLDPPSQSTLEITKRRLPHWRLNGSVYFVTFRTSEQKLLSETDRSIVLQHLRAGDSRFYNLLAAVVMPDHVHVLLRPSEGVDLSRITKGMKGVSAKRLNVARNRSGTVWQAESWDRIIRDDVELNEKLQYMLDNPVKAGLVSDPWAYHAWYYNPQAIK